MQDTKSYQKRRSDIKRAVKKLGTVAEAVAKSPVFMVTKEDNYYQIRNYYNNTIQINYILSRNVADYICIRYNKNKPFSNFEKKNLKYLIEKSLDLNTKKDHYYQLIKSTKDTDSRSIFWARYDVLADRQKLVEHTLVTAVSK